MTRCNRFVLALIALLLSGIACVPTPGVRYPQLPKRHDGALHIVNFNVGQADAQLVMFGDKTLLIDCGSPLHDPSAASRVIPRRLDALLGHRHIDYFLITHYHRDHTGGPPRRGSRQGGSGVYALIERDNLTIGTILDRGFWTLGHKGASQKHYEQAVQRWIREGKVGSRRAVLPGDALDLGPGIEAAIISASGNGALDKLQRQYPDFVARAQPNENDYSVGVKISLGAFELFTAGDLSGRSVVRRYGKRLGSYTDIESRIAATVGAVEVYRVNHHGSSNSSNKCFAQTLHPQVSVFSTGKNRYGHPNPGVVTRLTGHGDVYITGAIAGPVNDIPKVHVANDDVEILVAPDGAQYWVNGRRYQSTSEADEAKNETAGACPPFEAQRPLTPEDYWHAEKVTTLPGD